jgi:FdhD protein
MMKNNSSIKKEITKYNGSSFERIEDDIAVEKKLRIFLKGKEIISLLCSPTMVKELVVGFAVSEGLFKGKGRFCPEDIVIEEKPSSQGSSYNYDIEAHLLLEAELDVHPGAVTSGCAKGVTFFSGAETKVIEDDLKIRPEPIFDLFREFQQRSSLYKLTGGVHSAALSDEKDIIVFAEDIGRHNAVDKIIGYCFLNDISTKGKILLSSGRLSSEIAYKAVRASIPILVSRTAPTTMAVEIAERNNLTIIGFLRGSRFTIYSYPERIIVP